MRPGGGMADATDLKSVAARHKGSTPFPGTINSGTQINLRFLIC